MTSKNLILVFLTLALAVGALLWVVQSFTSADDAETTGPIKNEAERTEGTLSKSDTEAPSAQISPIESVPLPGPPAPEPEPLPPQPAQMTRADHERELRLYLELKERFGEGVPSLLQPMTTHDLQEEFLASLSGPNDPRLPVIMEILSQHRRLKGQIKRAHREKCTEYALKEIDAGRFQPHRPGGSQEEVLGSIAQPEVTTVSDHRGTVVLRRGYSPEFDTMLRTRDDEIAALRGSLRDAIRRELSR